MDTGIRRKISGIDNITDIRRKKSEVGRGAGETAITRRTKSGADKNIDIGVIRKKSGEEKVSNKQPDTRMRKMQSTKGFDSRKLKKRQTHSYT